MQVCILIMILTLYFDLFFMCYTFKTPAICLVKTVLEFRILQDFGTCDKNSKKLQELSNDKIQPPAYFVVLYA